MVKLLNLVYLTIVFCDDSYIKAEYVVGNRKSKLPFLLEDVRKYSNNNIQIERILADKINKIKLFRISDSKRFDGTIVTFVEIYYTNNTVYKQRVELSDKFSSLRCV